MTQQYPNPYQQPVWGPQPPQRPDNTRKRALIIIGSVFGGGIFAMILLGLAVGGTDTRDTASVVDTATTSISAEPEAQKAPADEPAEEEPKKEKPPVEITAKVVPFQGGILAEGTDYTSIKVTIANNSGDEIGVNPLYFTITDTDGTKHVAELAADERQLDTVDLAPGENIAGVITGKGTFTARYVTYSDGLFGDPLRVKVS